MDFTFQVMNIFNDIISTNIVKIGLDYHYTVKTYDKYVKTKKSPKIFSIVRHPRTRAVSLYKFTQAYKYIPFSQFIEEYILSNKINTITHTQHLKINTITHTQHSYLSNNEGKIDENISIIRFENLDNEFKIFCKTNNIPYKEPLKKENKSVIISKDKVNFKKLPENLVKEFDDYFKLDYIAFGYTN